MYGQIGTQVGDIFKNIEQARTNQLDQEQSDREEAVKNSTMSETQKADAIKKIDADIAAKKKEIAREQQAMSIAQALINGAVGITKLWYENGALAPLFIGLEVASVASQIAVIASQKFASGGIVQGQGTGDTVPAMLSPGEVVLNSQQQAATLMAIAKGSAPSTTNKNVNLHMGDIVINGSPDNNTLKAIGKSREDQIRNTRKMLIQAGLVGASFK